MPDFMKRRQLSRMLDRNVERWSNLPVPEKGWVSTMRQALGMSADQVAIRKGVSRNAVYQAERSEKEGAVSLKQMERLAKAMGGTFVYAIVPDEPIETLKYKQAVRNAQELAVHQSGFLRLSSDEQQDWIDDTAAQQLQHQPTGFWEARDRKPE